MSDVRLSGFDSCVSLDAALAWIDAHTAPLPPETIDVADAIGRVVTSPIASPADWPAVDCAADDGYAVVARQTEGASDYNPLPIPDRLVAAGQPMPVGTDAIVPFAMVQRHGTALEVLTPIAPGSAIDRRGSFVRAGTLVAAAERLRPQDVALMSALGVGVIPAVRRPRVVLVVAGPKAGPDLLSPMLSSLIANDGGVPASGSLALKADLILLVGRTGAGPDDDAAQTLAGVGGVLDLHGFAVRPGGSAGLGSLNGVPVLLVPGAPHACFAIYHLLVSPALRRLAGLQPVSGTPSVLDRKIASAVGYADMVQIRRSGTTVTPVGPAGAGSLAHAAQADGFLVVPGNSEGYPAGASVTVHMYRP